MSTAEVLGGEKVEYERSRTGPVVVPMTDDLADNDVVSWAARFAQDTSSEVIVVRSWTPLLGELRPQAQQAEKARILAEMRAWAQPVADLEVPVRFQVLEGDDVESLDRFVTDAAAALLVVRCDRRRSWLGLDAGTYLYRLARASRVPLAVVPPGGSAHGLRRQLVGVNESASSRAAIEWAARTAASHRATVHAVAVFEPVVEWVPADHPQSPWQLVRKRLEDDWTAPLAAAGVHYSTEVVEGSRVVDALTRSARRHRVDAVVLGAGDHRGLFHRGTLGIHLAQHSGLAVIIVSADAGAQISARETEGHAHTGAQ